MRFPEWFRPPKLPVPAPRTSCRDECVMEVRESGDVPGITSQGARQEAAGVIHKVGNHHLNDLQRKLGGRGRARIRYPWGGARRTYSPNSG